MPVSQPSKEYQEHVSRYKLVRALDGGEDYLKGKIGGYEKTDFLPLFDADLENARYKKYVERAVYYNYLGWTKKGFVGFVFRKPLEVELSKNLEYALDNFDGSGSTVETFTKYVVGETILCGRIGLLVDVSEKQAKTVTYAAESIINWKLGKKDGNVVLKKVVLKEVIEREVDEFSSVEEDQFRVLYIADDGYYYQAIYDKNNDLVEDGIEVQNVNGQRFDVIPFVFVGAENNSPDFDKPPLLDIGFINLGHYRNSADHEENLFIHGQGTMFISSDLTPQQFKDANPNGVIVGAREGHFIGSNGKAELLQVEASNALGEAMEKKVEQMIGLGAKFISESRGNVRVEGVKMDKAQQENSLSLLVSNVESALMRCIDWMQFIMSGFEEKVTFKLNRDFFDNNISAQEATASVMLVDSGIMSKYDVRSLLKRSGWIRSEKTNEEIDEEIDTAGLMPSVE